MPISIEPLISVIVGRGCLTYCLTKLVGITLSKPESPSKHVPCTSALVGADVRLRTNTSEVAGQLKEVNDTRFVVAVPYLVNRQRRYKSVTVEWKALSLEQRDERGAAASEMLDPDRGVDQHRA